MAPLFPDPWFGRRGRRHLQYAISFDICRLPFDFSSLWGRRTYLTDHLVACVGRRPGSQAGVVPEVDQEALDTAWVSPPTHAPRGEDARKVSVFGLISIALDTLLFLHTPLDPSSLPKSHAHGLPLVSVSY